MYRVTGAGAAAVTTMTLETRLIDGHEQAVSNVRKAADVGDDNRLHWCRYSIFARELAPL